MKALTTVNDRCAIVYDGDCIKDPSDSLFDPAAWKHAGLLVGQAPGRGSAMFVDAPFGQAVLRRYFRGGWPARVSRDRYLYTGLQRSRPFREFKLLSELALRGLPAPVPLAAFCERERFSYRGALLTRRLEHVMTLGDMLGKPEPTITTWSAVGACIDRFHQAGVSHADLNVRNILVRQQTGEVFLVDFDRSVYRPGRAVDGRPNLTRLRRSVQKMWPPGSPVNAEDCWQALLQGYGR